MSGGTKLEILEEALDMDSKEDKKNLSILDKRRVSAEGPVSGNATEPNLKPSYVETLENRVRKTEEAFKERVSSLEDETAKSLERLKRDLELRFESGKRDLFREVLEILDDLDRAATATDEKSLNEGLKVISNSVEGFLKRHECSKLLPEKEEFDPETMEAISTAPGEKGVVVAVAQPGYHLGETLIRPARVVVGNGSVVED